MWFGNRQVGAFELALSSKWQNMFPTRGRIQETSWISSTQASMKWMEFALILKVWSGESDLNFYDLLLEIQE